MEVPKTLTPRRQRRILAATSLTALTVYVTISLLAASILSKPRRSLSNQTPANSGLTYQDVRIASRDAGVEIAAWYIPTAQTKRVLILVPGKDSSRTSEFGNRFLDFARGLHEHGVNILMIDLRGHGASTPSRLTFGLKEKHDVEGAADWLRSMGYGPENIGVLGVSLGASTSLMAAADDSDIAAVAADSGYGDLYPVIEKNWGGLSGLPRFFLPGVRLAGEALYGFDVAKVRPLDSIRFIAPRPVFLIHGADDSLISVDQAYALKAAYPGADLWIVPGAQHAAAYGANPKEYISRVSEFFDRALK